MLMPKKILKAFIGFFRVRYFKIEYYIEAVFRHLQHKLYGGNPLGRLLAYPGAVFTELPATSSRRLALFVAYHPNARLPLSNRAYLEALRTCGFRIIYIHNGPLDAETIASLEVCCERVYCRMNIGQDFGAWKDGYLYAYKHGLLEGVDWLLMCNDSNHYVGGLSGEQFVARLTEELDRGDSELIALHKNYELWQHYQSYFLCYHQSVFSRNDFHCFWLNYTPLSHRYYAIEKGEIALTSDLLFNTKSTILYRSSDLLSCLESLAEDPAEFYSFLPQSALYLAPSGAVGHSIDALRLQRVLALLDYHNPSHVYALLFAKYLFSPFLKKDLLRQGTFSMPQIYSLLASIGLPSASPSLCHEIVCYYESGGTNVSFIRYPRAAFRKGINVSAKAYVGHGDVLEGLGMKSLE